eukprot:gnl/TRDRNA2_/TRDRNA2_90881_c0_seq1.p1 gnl/TRDRNA2_/TRDRNA2_90881_c0~~gnl/TRDRNA2_/TRDRNA2_90881_c0_seq1.p1  ORF type:complete len:249 (-),score=50.57 gnl/TRDRNA2_/TRDRNA2_90881_c0_seq1:431-1156(-)
MALPPPPPPQPTLQPPALPRPDLVLNLGRAGIVCANPKCWFLVHEKPSFGGYCCKKCHWVQAYGSKTGKRHGQQCAKQNAPEGAPRAPPQPPDEPLPATPGKKGQGQVSEDFFASGTQEYQAGSSEWPASARDYGQKWDASWQQSPSKKSIVRLKGFESHASFNSLRAVLDGETGDGRYNLRLFDGTQLLYVKPDNFERVEPVDRSAMSVATPQTADPIVAPAPPPPPPGPPPPPPAGFGI